MELKILISTQNMSYEEWKEMRRKGIGGSDAAAIAGLSKWKSPVAVYLEKIGQAPKEEVKSEAAYFGTKLEDFVAKEFSKRTGFKVRRKNAMLQHPDYPFILANVDRLIIGKKEGLECKIASEYLKQEWEDEEVPTQYLVQCQHYMAVTGYQAWWIAVLIGGNKFVYKKIERDQELIKQLIEIETDFWNKHVLLKEPPLFDGSQASTDLLSHMYPKGIDEEIELPESVNRLLEDYQSAKQAKAEAISKVKKIENQIKAMLGEYERGVTKEHVVTWRNVQTNRFDKRAFEKDHPELLKKYTKIDSYRRFSFK
jgi:putative phage-type endonuclease